MSQINLLNTDENVDLNMKQNDVDPSSHQITKVTKALHTDVEEIKNISVHSPSALSVDQSHEDDSVNNLSTGSSKYRSQESKNVKRKTRRGKTKRGKSNSKSYGKTQWKFQIPRVRADKRRSMLGLSISGQSVDQQPPLVPYNTNKFLMEDHMPHIATPSGRTRDSSFSIDSEENYFYSLPEDEEEFLTKEFASVYEDARCERLEGMSKSQLIQEYLQLEATFEQLSRRYNTKIGKDDDSVGTKEETTAAIVQRRMEDRLRELTSENLELRRQLEHAARIGVVMSAKSSPRNLERMCSSSSNSSSEDSESDSSSSGSSSSGRDVNDESMMALGLDDEAAQPLSNDFAKQNGYHHHEDGDDEDAFSSPPVSPLSPNSVNINSPPPLVIN